MSNVIWFVPGLMISVVVGLAASRPVARWLRARPTLVWVLLVSLGTIIAATLSPVREPTGFEVPGAGVGVCDFSRIGPAPLDALRTINEISLNVLLFVPFGVAVGLLPNGPRKALVVLAAFALPFAIEAIQLVATTLHRGCQSGDVADNLTGLVAGLIIGEAVRRVAVEEWSHEGREPIPAGQARADARTRTANRPITRSKIGVSARAAEC